MLSPAAALHRGTEGILPPANPPVSIPPVPNLNCEGSGCADPCAIQAVTVESDSPPCVTAALKAIDSARAREGVRAMVLPSNWYTLSVAEQIFVLTDLERVDRGLPPYLGMVAVSDAAALPRCPERY